MAFERRANTQLALKFRTPVRIDWFGDIVFNVRSSLVAIENLVTAYINHSGADLLASLSHETRRFGIVTHRSGGIVLATSRVGPSGGVDDCIGPPAIHRLSHLLVVGYVELRMAWGRHVLSLQGRVQCAAQLPVPAGNQDAHVRRFKRPSSGKALWSRLDAQSRKRVRKNFIYLNSISQLKGMSGESQGMRCSSGSFGSYSSVGKLTRSEGAAPTVLYP